MISAVVVASGTGSRFGRDEGKQLTELAGIPLVGHAVLALERCADVDEVVLVCHPDRVTDVSAQVVVALGLAKVSRVLPGGETRQESVAAGLGAVSEGASIIVVHDGARPLVTPDIFTRAIEALRCDAAADGVVVGHPAIDTLKSVDAHRTVTGTPDRARLWVAQTPQVFRARVLRRAHSDASASGFIGTDDASLVERAGGVVRMVEGPRHNIKVTVPEDLVFAAALLAAGEGA
jgi:2-C-methyl-D-erythritol 4-phosphate cytidylyltransferase